MFKVGNEATILYGEKQKYRSSRKLYELSGQLEHRFLFRYTPLRIFKKGGHLIADRIKGITVEISNDTTGISKALQR